MITINARFDSILDEVDCFRFIADDSFAGEKIVIDLTDIPTGHDYDIYLYRDYDDCLLGHTAALETGENGGNADEQLCYMERFALDDGGTYYIQVERFRGNSCTEDYSLSVDGLRDPRPCP